MIFNLNPRFSLKWELISCLQCKPSSACKFCIDFFLGQTWESHEILGYVMLPPHSYSRRHTVISILSWKELNRHRTSSPNRCRFVDKIARKLREECKSWNLIHWPISKKSFKPLFALTNSTGVSWLYTFKPIERISSMGYIWIWQQ